MSEESLFEAALAVPDAERGAFLDRECGADKNLRSRVQALLSADDAPVVVLDRPRAEEPQPAPSDLTAFVQPDMKPDVVIGGRYTLLEKLGEGGMGEVWVAKQSEPVKRRVALKLIKTGMDSKAVLNRFEQERQALGMMDHPNIAKVLDGGMTPTGQPFFVMELVNGLPLLKYCDEAKLTPKERLELFVHICQAVQHAHQKGIVHRDLKPANILVTLVDGVGVPKVIDFGVAKATAGKLTDESMFTQFGSVVGTLEYMAPEQAGFAGEDIDTRADIYSLGVILYELLTGLKPIDAKRLKNTALLEMIRVIKEEDPLKPSTRLSNENTLPSLAAARQIDPRRLMAMLRGELDWVVMKCLEKKRDRRYETANGLAADVRRYLANEPVTARPPSVTYRMQKAWQRNKLGYSAAGAVAAALLIGIAVSLWQASRAHDEATRAKEAEQRATTALGELRKSAPAFVEHARALAAQEQFGEAIVKLDYAIELRPDVAEYLVAKGDLLQCQFKLAAAAAVYREALHVKPGLARAESSAKLCDELLAAPLSDKGKLTRESLAKLYLLMQEQQRPAGELLPVARLFGEEKEQIVQYWLERLKDQPIPDLKDRLTVRDDGLLALNLTNTKIINLAPLAGMPLGSLTLDGCKQVSDFSPLEIMRSLTSLQLRRTQITDLSPLRRLRLEELALDQTHVFDISALRGLKLKTLSLRDTRVAALLPLAGMPLAFFDASMIPATDYSPLAGAPLQQCIIQNSPIRDLSFLKNSPVKELTLFNCAEARGFAVLAGLTSLDLLILPHSFRSLPDEELDAIGALRAHPTLKNIQTELRTGSFPIKTAQAKDDFWKDWDREQSFAAPLRKAGIKFKLVKFPDGTFSLAMSNQPLRDLSMLKDAPLSKLKLEEMPVSDLTALNSPNLSRSLKELYFWRIEATDFSPVAVCKNLVAFEAPDTNVSTLEFLRGLKLSTLRLNSTKVTDLSPLAGLPLETVILNHTHVTDLTPLLQCRALRTLGLPTKPRNVGALRQLPALAEIGYEERGQSRNFKTAADFWQTEGSAEELLPWLVKDSAKNPSNTMLALKVGALQLWFGRNAEFAATVDRELAWGATSTKIDDLERISKLSSLDPMADVPTREAARRLAHKAVELGRDNRKEGPWTLMTLGMANYRNGNYAEAIQHLAAAEAAAPSTKNEQYSAQISGTAAYYRAMSLFQQGKRDEARALFTATEATAKPCPADVSTLEAKANHDDLILWLAFKEAKALLAEQGAPGKQQEAP